MPDTEQKYDFSVKCGDKFKIEVESNPSTGYKWHLLSFDEDIVKLVSSEFVSKLTNHVGSLGREHFNFEAKKKGSTSIKLVYRRTWEKQPMKPKEYFVIVT